MSYSEKKHLLCVCIKDYGFYYGQEVTRIAKCSAFIKKVTTSYLRFRKRLEQAESPTASKRLPLELSVIILTMPCYLTIILFLVLLYFVRQRTFIWLMWEMGIKMDLNSQTWLSFVTDLKYFTEQKPPRQMFSLKISIPMTC